MPDYSWPAAEQRTLIGKRISRVDSPLKVSGRAKYNQDYHGQGMLFGKVLRSPYAKAKIVSIDTSAAERMAGVNAVEVIQKPGATIHWAGDEIVAVAAVDEGTAEDAIRAIKVEYQKLTHMVNDAEPPAGAGGTAGPMSQEDIWDATDLMSPPQVAEQLGKVGVSFQASEAHLAQMKKFGMPDVILDAIKKAHYYELGEGGGSSSAYQKAAGFTQGDPDKAFAEAEVVSEGLYGIPVITHCCLESHGSTSEWPDKDHLLMHISTQNVSGIGAQLAEPIGVPAANVRVHQDHIGGGFGSKFAVDRWDVTGVRLSKKAGGKPVRIFLERDAELEVAGARPSAFARVKVAVKRDGTLTGWQSQPWGTGGPGGGSMPPIPYIFTVPNQRKEHTAIRTNIGPARAWRAPNHPQAAALTMTALEDAAAKLNMDPREFFLKNIDLTGPRKNIYREELGVAADLMDWKNKWRPRGQNISGGRAHGLGLSIHTWGGRGHESHWPRPRSD